MKRSDQVVADIKRWIVQTHQKVGDKLPQEAALIEQMGVARGTVREALAALQVQGLVTVSTGPNGGATLAQLRMNAAWKPFATSSTSSRWTLPRCTPCGARSNPSLPPTWHCA